jgi:hypothetical protein
MNFLKCLRANKNEKNAFYRMLDVRGPLALPHPVVRHSACAFCPEAAMNQTLAAPSVWADGKRHLWWLGIMPLATPLLSGALAISTGVQQLWWVGVLVIFGLIPLIDGLLGEDVSNPPESAVGHLESQRYYRWIVYTGVLFVIASVVITGWLAAGGIAWIIDGGLLQATAHLDPADWLSQVAAYVTARTQLHGEPSWFTYLGMAMSTGAATGIAINTAHELGHKPKPLEVFLAKVTRALLHRTQPWPSRPRRDPGRSGQLAPGGKLLGISTTLGVVQRALGLEP